MENHDKANKPKRNILKSALKSRLALGIIVIATVFLSFVFIEIEKEQNLDTRELINIIFLNYDFLIFSMIVIIIISFMILHDMDVEYKEYIAKQNQQEESKLFRERVLDEKKDILELRIENMNEIKEYFEISKRQAISSFNLSRITCIVGIILLVFAIIMCFVASKDTAIITTIAGAVVEIFSVTALLVHRDSIKQLNKYYDSLHENEQFLSSVHLVGKLAENKKDEIYI